jgi:hypothetical protein
MKKKNPTQFIEFPPHRTVWAINREGRAIEVNPSGLHIETLYPKATIHYAGEGAADESYTKLEIPSDTKFLRAFAHGLEELAKKLETQKKD